MSPTSPEGASLPYAVLQADGASWGNPGEAGCAYVLRDRRGKELAAEGRYLGRATNNVAEYQGLIAGLRKAKDLGIAELVVRLDSELIVSQLTGVYRVRAEHLKSLFDLAKGLLASFAKTSVQHTPRANNARADELATQAIKNALAARRS
jgi:ribonuclease HI